MKPPIFLRRWMLPMLALLGGCAAQAPATVISTTETVVYLVRHAEKDLTPGLTDPPLTAAGQQRAAALRKELRKQPVAALFTTNTSRTRATIQPLADQLKLVPQVYDARQLPALAARIRREYRGRPVVVVGHSNTVLETAVALGAPSPFAAINDAEYSYLLEVHLPADTAQAAVVQVRHYGAQ